MAVCPLVTRESLARGPAAAQASLATAYWYGLEMALATWQLDAGTWMGTVRWIA